MAIKTNPNRREYLAAHIAETFNDREHLTLYLNVCQRYSLVVVLKAFAEAKSIPQASIKKSRIALFFYLTNVYANQIKTYQRK
jgi:hypothetical protein